MVKTSPNTRPSVLWASQTRQDGVQNLWPLDGAARHIPGGSCPCGPVLDAGQAEPIWIHKTELQRLIVPNYLPEQT